MDPKLLKLVPKQYLCPCCREWHTFFYSSVDKFVNHLAYYNSPHNQLHLNCSRGCGSVFFYFGEVYCYFQIIKKRGNEMIYITNQIPIADITEDPKSCQITFSVPHINERGLVYDYMFGFEFTESEIQKLKEDITMTNKTTNNVTIKQQLFEHSPKENIELLKNWVNKYKPVLQWTVPVASIYAAYRILNSKKSKLDINNIDDVCEEKLGFKLDCLTDKKGLKELLILGGVCSGVYGVFKVFSGISSSNNSIDDVSVEEIENSMDELEKKSQKFAWLQPKTEAMLPIAISVIIVFVMTNPTKFKDNQKFHALTENLSIKWNLFVDMAKMFIADKFKIDFTAEKDAQQFKKVALLSGIGAVLVFLYGKKMLGKNAILDENEAEKKSNPKMEAFTAQLFSILKKLAPAAFAAITTILISKKLLKADADTEFDEVEFEEYDEENIDEENIPDPDSDETEE